jgi:large subunit ribosomal protein L23
MKSPYDIIKCLLVTEKSTKAQEKFNKYTFLVDKRSNKIEIKRAVQDIYKVKVEDVNTINSPGKLRRVRFQAGYTPSYKKAVVTLKKGEKIDQKI